MPLKDDILALANLRRSRRNLDTVKSHLDDLREHADAADEAVSAADDARNELEQLSEALDADDNPFLPWSAVVREAALALVELLPEEGESPGEIIQEAEDYAQEYEECLEDKDPTADDREEIWGNLIDALANIAGMLS